MLKANIKKKFYESVYDRNTKILKKFDHELRVRSSGMYDEDLRGEDIFLTLIDSLMQEQLHEDDQLGVVLEDNIVIEDVVDVKTPKLNIVKLYDLCRYELHDDPLRSISDAASKALRYYKDYMKAIYPTKA